MAEALSYGDEYDDDISARAELARQEAENPLLAYRVHRALSVGLLHEGLRHCGVWARQWRLGPLSILVVRLDQHPR